MTLWLLISIFWLPPPIEFRAAASLVGQQTDAGVDECNDTPPRRRWEKDSGLVQGLVLKMPGHCIAPARPQGKEGSMAIKMNEKEQAGFDVLRAEMSEELAMEIVEFRREKKAKITARIARALLKEYKRYGNIEEAATIQMTRNWIGFECEWVKPKGRTFHDTNNPMPAQSANYGRPEPVAVPETISPEEAERRRQMVAKLRAEGVIGRTMQ